MRPTEDRILRGWQEIKIEGCVSAFGRWQKTQSEGCVSASARWQETGFEGCVSVFGTLAGD